MAACALTVRALTAVRARRVRACAGAGAMAYLTDKEAVEMRGKLEKEDVSVDTGGCSGPRGRAFSVRR